MLYFSKVGADPGLARWRDKQMLVLALSESFSHAFNATDLRGEKSEGKVGGLFR
jgi:hypothetical protein